MHHAAKKIRRDHITPQRGALLIPSLDGKKAEEHWISAYRESPKGNFGFWMLENMGIYNTGYLPISEGHFSSPCKLCSMWLKHLAPRNNCISQSEYLQEATNNQQIGSASNLSPAWLFGRLLQLLDLFSRSSPRGLWHQRFLYQQGTALEEAISPVPPQKSCQD